MTVVPSLDTSSVVVVPSPGAGRALSSGRGESEVEVDKDWGVDMMKVRRRRFGRVSWRSIEV